MLNNDNSGDNAIENAISEQVAACSVASERAQRLSARAAAPAAMRSCEKRGLRDSFVAWDNNFGTGYLSFGAETVSLRIILFTFDAVVAADCGRR